MKCLFRSIRTLKPKYSQPLSQDRACIGTGEVYLHTFCFLGSFVMASFFSLRNTHMLGWVSSNLLDPRNIFLLKVVLHCPVLISWGRFYNLAFWKQSHCSHLCDTAVQGILQLPTTILFSYNPESVLFEITGKQSKFTVGSLPLIIPSFFTMTICHSMLFESFFLGLILILPSKSLWKLSFSIPNE